MKRTLLTLIIAIMALTARAISYDDARQQAWFITDKMAYELNLTPEQYDRAYQINLDYLMSLNGPTDITGAYWQYRDIDLRCILFDWQYNLLSTLDYFYRPVRWYATRWYYPVYDHYRIGYYYYTRPNIYITYHGCTWHRRRPDRPSPYASWRPRRGAGMRGYGPHHRHPHTTTTQATTTAPTTTTTAPTTPTITTTATTADQADPTTTTATTTTPTAPTITTTAITTTTTAPTAPTITTATTADQAVPTTITTTQEPVQPSATPTSTTVRQATTPLSEAQAAPPTPVADEVSDKDNTTHYIIA